MSQTPVTPVTFVNVFDVDPAKQSELVELLEEGLDRVIRHRDGFVAARLLVASDGSRVINEVDWDGREAAAATQTDTDAGAYARRTAALASATPGIYIVHARIEKAS